MSQQEECIFQAQRLAELDAEIKAKDGYIKGLEDTVDNLYSIIEEYKKALEMACEEIAKSHPILSALGYDYYRDRYLQKARQK